MRRIRRWLATKVARWLLADAAGADVAHLTDRQLREYLQRIRWSQEYIGMDDPYVVARLRAAVTAALVAEEAAREDAA